MNLIINSATKKPYTVEDKYGIWNFVVDNNGVHSVQIENGRITLRGNTWSREELGCSESDALQDMADSYEFSHNQGVSSEEEIILLVGESL